MLEEGAGEIGVPSHVSGMALDLAMQLAQIIRQEVGKIGRPGVTEQILDGVELGSICGKTDYSQPVFLGGEKLGCLAAPVRGEAVPHEDDSATHVPPEGSYEILDLSGFRYIVDTPYTCFCTRIESQLYG